MDRDAMVLDPPGQSVEIDLDLRIEEVMARLVDGTAAGPDDLALYRDLIDRRARRMQREPAPDAGLRRTG